MFNFINVQSRPSPWSDERIEHLRKLVGERLLSFAEMAARLGGGITRNGAIGKAKRLGLCIPHVANPNPTPKPSRPAPSRIRLSTTRLRKPPTFQSPPVAIIPTCEPVTLMQLEPHHCRYPVSDDNKFLFCGADKERGSYCFHHANLCYAGHTTLGAAEAEIRRRLMARKARAA